MRATADIEQDAVGRIGGDQRSVALAPVGKLLEQAGIGRLVLRHGDERWMHGACLRECQPGAQAASFRGGIERNQQIAVAAFAEDNKRGRHLTRLPCEPVGRKPLQPQAQDALRA